MASAARSAAERVFAIAELLEDIVLRVVQDELQDPFVEKKNNATSFKLQRINRDAYRNIAGSTRIRELALVRTDTEKLDTWDRICWLCSESLRWRFGAQRGSHNYAMAHGHFVRLDIAPRDSWLDDNSDASWRSLNCLPIGTQPVKLDIFQSIPSRLWHLGMNPQPLADDIGYMPGEIWKKRLTTWELNDQYTLGQLYDDLVGVEDEQSEAFAKG